MIILVPPVPVISHPAAIVTLSSQVGNSIKRNIGIFVDKHLQLTHTDTKVRLVEPVRNIPSKGSKLSPLLY